MSRNARWPVHQESSVWEEISKRQGGRGTHGQVMYGHENKAKELGLDSGCEGRIVSKQITCQLYLDRFTQDTALSVLCTSLIFNYLHPLICCDKCCFEIEWVLKTEHWIWWYGGHCNLDEGSFWRILRKKKTKVNWNQGKIEVDDCKDGKYRQMSKSAIKCSRNETKVGRVCGVHLVCMMMEKAPVEKIFFFLMMI